MHHWEDKDVDWNAINDCCNYFWKMSRRYGRMGGDIKEKYGTIRFYAQIGYLSLHGLLFPGWVCKHPKFPKWLWRADIYYIGPVLRFFFEKLFIKWQIFIYNRMYQNALRKWPHIQAEILSCADHPELIKGRTRREGKELHILDLDGKIVMTWVTSQWI